MHAISNFLARLPTSFPEPASAMMPPQQGGTSAGRRRRSTSRPRLRQRHGGREWGTRGRNEKSPSCRGCQRSTVEEFTRQQRLSTAMRLPRLCTLHRRGRLRLPRLGTHRYGSATACKEEKGRVPSPAGNGSEPTAAEEGKREGDRTRRRQEEDGLKWTQVAPPSASAAAAAT